MARDISFQHMMARIQGKPYKRIDKRERHDDKSKSVYISAFKHAHFIAWDGEGITDTEHSVNGIARQHYALLMNSEGCRVVDMQGIPTEVCLSTLLNYTQDKKAIHICFGASYDVNMMLRDVPVASLRMLHDGGKVDYGKYQLEYRPRKSFTVREYMSVHQKYRKGNDGRRVGWFKNSMTLWDVFGFFQCKFTDALESYFLGGNMLPHIEEKYRSIIAKIEEGKNRRGTFTIVELLDFVEPYCRLEVNALKELMEVLHRHLTYADMQISRWDGAGACATALLQKYAVKHHIKEDDIPQDVIIASEYAYFGGRIETLRYGNYEGDVYHEDINSAYPTELVDIPSFIGGEWVHAGITLNQNVKHLPKVSLFLVSWRMRGDTTICPFPWRDKQGNVFFPPYGKAWVHKPELEVAIEKFDCDIYIHERWSFYPETDYKPFHFIPELYAYRQKLVQENNAAEKVIKLGMNSLYGKMAQSIGYGTERGKGKPPYHNLIVAGLVTSGVRARLLRAAMQKPKSVIMLATDGIYSTDKLSVETSTTKELGKWESKVHDYITIVASGVYWYNSMGKETSYSRGFDKYSLLRDDIICTWKAHRPVLLCATTRFVTIGSAIGLNDFNLWCTWRTIDRELGLDMDTVVKRVVSTKHPTPHKSLVRTIAATPKQLLHVDGVLLFPYQGSFVLSHKYTFSWDNTNRTDMIDGLNMREYLDEVANSTS